MITNLVVSFYLTPHRRCQNVDVEICSPFARPDLSTNVYVVTKEDVTFFLFQLLLKPLGLESPFLLSLNLHSQKRIRDAGNFTAVNPPMSKSAQGVYGKTMQFRFLIAYSLLKVCIENGLVSIWQSFPFSQFFCPILHWFLPLL